MQSYLHSNQTERLEEQACANLEHTPDTPFNFACVGKLPWIESLKADDHLEAVLGYQHCSTPRGLNADMGLHRPFVKDSPCPEGFAAVPQDRMSEDSR